MGMPDLGKGERGPVKLDVSMLVEHLENRQIMVAMPEIMPIELGPQEKLRKVINAKVVGKIEKAEKYIFDSGSDRDAGTTEAVRSTAIAMMQGNLFHLPSKVTWIEDPFDAEDQDDKEFFAGRDLRNYYLCIEEGDQIVVWFFNSIPPGLGIEGKIRFSMFSLPIIIDLKHPREEYLIPGLEREPHPIYCKGLAEAVYAIKKFVVTLATKDSVRERVRAKPQKARIPKKFREYDHTIIRVPYDRTEGEALGFGGSGRKRRRHLVPGYWWGKNTRPIEGQKFIEPYWRGSQEIGIIDPGARHHVVETKPAKRA